MRSDRILFFVATIVFALFLTSTTAYANNVVSSVDGSGGTIDPLGQTKITSVKGEVIPIDFTLEPGSGYKVDKLILSWGGQNTFEVQNECVPVPDSLNCTYVFTESGNDFTLVASFAPIPVEASFSVSPASTVGEATYPIQFTDTSTNGADSWTWDFGDQTPVSSDQHPVHTYAVPGTYTVTLTTANTLNGTSSISEINYTVIQPTIAYDASAGPNGSISPSGNLIVNEGSTTRFAITPHEFYQVADVLVDGTSICAEIPDVTCDGITAVIFDDTDKVDHTITASFEPIPVVASFSGPSGEITTDDQVQFTDMSQGNLTFWKWYVGNELVIDNTVPDPVLITFPEAGDYTVTLEVGNAATSHSFFATYTVEQSGPPKQVSVGGSGAEYGSIMEAYNVIPASGETIKMKAGDITEELLLFDDPVIFFLKGGYDEWSGADNGYTRIKGIVQISNGTVIISKVIIAPTI